MGVLSSIALVMPNLIDPPEAPADWLRGVIGPLVFATVGAIVNELSRQQRLRTTQAEAHVVERTAALAANEEILEQLKSSEQQYRALSESFTSLWNSITGQAVIATDNHGTITAWNPGAVRLLGMEVPDALAAVQIDRFFPSHALAPFVPEHGPTPGDELHPGLRALFDDADAGLPVDSHIDVAREGGSTVPARVTVTPYQDSDGSRHGYPVSYTHLTLPTILLV